MIRREDIGDEALWYPVRLGFVRRVKSGESVRIVNLGTLARVYDDRSNGVSNRLTLTAAVAKAWAAASSRGTRFIFPEREGIKTDVRLLARALGAPVEVYAPGGGKHPADCMCGGGVEHAPVLLTTVSP